MMTPSALTSFGHLPRKGGGKKRPFTGKLAFAKQMTEGVKKTAIGGLFLILLQDAPKRRCRNGV